MYYCYLKRSNEQVVEEEIHCTQYTSRWKLYCIIGGKYAICYNLFNNPISVRFAMQDTTTIATYRKLIITKN